MGYNYSEDDDYVEDYYKGEFYNFQEFEEYTPEQVKGILDDLVKQAYKQGLVGVYLSFLSTMEPYEDYLGSPLVKAVGYRKKTTSEKKEQTFEEEVGVFSKRYNVTYPEARVLLNVKARGLIEIKEVPIL